MAHVSYSEIKLWHECPRKHKLQYIDKIDGFKGNLHTAFGTAIHSVCEHGLLDENLDRGKHFLEEFAKEVASLKEKEVEIESKLYEQMMGQYEPIVSSFRDELDNYFEDCEVVSTEEKLYEDMEGHDLKFKGFIDLVVKTRDGKYHILDWKTTSWGWNSRRKSDKIVNYQLTLYKYFWAQKHGIPLDMVETHFGLLKRTAKKNNTEIFRVTSGPTKVRNALTFLEKAVINIKRKLAIKNRLSCKGCAFYKTQHCS
jgi:predicted RecB family nuclease